jgi:tricorn protease-like protein
MALLFVNRIVDQNEATSENPMISNDLSGEVRRLTYLGSVSQAVAMRTRFSSIRPARSAMRAAELMRVSAKSGGVNPFNLGPGTSLAINAKDNVVLERKSYRPDPAHWQHYHGGAAGYRNHAGISWCFWAWLSTVGSRKHCFSQELQC